MKKYILVLIALLLVYTRFIGLDWGLPFPMHPDERNMADAVVRLRCDVQLQTWTDLRNCFNPQFFAYGQLPLYMALIVIKVWQLVASLFSQKIVINFSIASLGLRIVSASLSVCLSYAMWQLYLFLKEKIPETKGLLNFSYIWFDFIALILIVFQPYLIQYSHYGTTETLLMLLFVLIVYFSLRYIDAPSWNWIARSGCVAGIAVAAKISALIYGAIPLFALLYCVYKSEHFPSVKKKISAILRHSFTFVVVFMPTYILSSPHNILSWKDFVTSMHYEIPVGNGTLLVFYTRQFIDTIPYLFQFTHIFPYALGLPVFILFVMSFLILPWKNQYVTLLRFSWLVYFIVTGSLFIKWSRFMAPIMPLMTIMALVGLLYVCRNINFQKKIVRLCLMIVGLLMVIPGYAYLAIYTHTDVRFTASHVIATRIPAGSYIFEEAGNSINIPVPPPDTPILIPFYTFNAVDLYEMTKESDLQKIQRTLDQADTLIIPSRRIFASRTCLRPSDVGMNLSDHLLNQNCEKLTNMYPYHQEYYKQIFGEKSEFIQTARVSSFPRIEFFGKILLEFPDEFAEETWTVFDHPVIRIYERVNPLN